MIINNISDVIYALDEIAEELNDSRLFEIADHLRDVSGKIEDLI